MASSQSPLQLSLETEGAVHLMEALIQYQSNCRARRIAYPAPLQKLLIQVSRRVTLGQESSTFDPVLPIAEAGPVTELVRFPDAARMLACSLSTLKRRVRDGVFEPVRNGRSVHLRRTDIESFIESGGA